MYFVFGQMQNFFQLQQVVHTVTTALHDYNIKKFKKKQQVKELVHVVFRTIYGTETHFSNNIRNRDTFFRNSELMLLDL